MRAESGPSPGQSPWNPQRIRELLVAAGKLAAELREDIRFELKPDSSLVTQADRQIEALFASEFDRPEQGSFLIGEETVEEKGEDYLRDAFRGTAYIVDPIDGTAPYAHLLANWGISVGRMQAGVLTDGAVFLPDYRLMVLSDGPAVLAGTRPEGSEKWTYRKLVPPPVETGPSGLVAITQDLAKLGRVSLANPVQALGSAVVPLVGMLVGRFLAYVGSLRLWDIAGSLPLLHRLTFSVTRLQAPAGTPLGLEVGPESYLLDPDDSYRWGVRGGVLVCPALEVARIRKGVGL
jgi:fructose-1,6-bisphosphatase/inositol monophosphatase family enzyme